MRRFGNSISQDPNARYAKAIDAAAARDAAANPSLPHQALRWSLFVQKITHVPGNDIQRRDSSASPKGMGTSLIEMIGTKLARGEGLGLRNPRLVHIAMHHLSPR
ncbi:MAG: hypothetical protein R3C68_06835 [Myxococcota bacterium]